MKSNSNVGIKVGELSNILQNTAIVLPVFVRFQIVNHCLTIPVMSIKVIGDTLEVCTTEGISSVGIELLVDIAVFQDASGKTVFLTDFPTGSDLAEEYRNEIEAELEYTTRLALFYQDVYLPITFGKVVYKPTVRITKRKIKVYRHVVGGRKSFKEAA